MHKGLFFLFFLYFLSSTIGQSTIVQTSKGERLTILNSYEEAKAIPPGKTFAMICGKCKGVWMTIVRKASKEHLSWFDSSQWQNCPGLCKGLIHSKETKTHKQLFLCSHCGEHSAFACCGS
ncbi:hypothetical protein A946_00575 [Methylacidiphilum kamchatkense Kam1]|uniref:Secreted protein n=1 Tax=Methylacidiphilum kamchatkense Kam1 TaxID=1202785 RepID=A0A0C1RMI9_9BACT|nr:hypothetical protein [Methylacidiphilum kamchatkense]KIE59257.1 hypothetical protein A946_00575 [Methylacidiphilum kamchatkense Kam1]QDQ42783.1 hypothetical protein kam1_1567 [Methylacidiphilum kamchatkense Kam1]